MDRRQMAEDNYRQKFEAFGLSERFVFLRREWSINRDKRFWSRCKSCGTEFLSWPEVFKGRQKRLLCPECGASSDGVNVITRSKKMKAAMDYYTAGHSVSETAGKYGFTSVQINNCVKQHGYSNGKDWRTEANRKRVEQSKKTVGESLSLRGFELLTEWVGTDHTYLLRNVETGEVIERRGHSLLPRQKKNNVYRARKRNAFIDSGITIDALIRRDGCACYLCGKNTTFTDRRWGNFGPDYPTIDHVIPLAAGGLHSWDNVKLACGACNVTKREKVVGE